MELDKQLVDYLVNYHIYFKHLTNYDNNFKQKLSDTNKLKYRVDEFLTIIDSCESVDKWYLDNIKFYKNVYIEISVINNINTIDELDNIESVITFIMSQCSNVQFDKIYYDTEIDFLIYEISSNISNNCDISKTFTSEESAFDYLESEMDSYTYMTDYTKRIGYHDDVESLRNYQDVKNSFRHEDGDYDTIVYINNRKCFIGYGFRYSDYYSDDEYNY